MRISDVGNFAGFTGGRGLHGSWMGSADAALSGRTAGL